MSHGPSRLTLPDTASIRQFMQAYGQTVRNEPTTGVTPQERILRGALVLEEAFELLQALGLKTTLGEGVQGDITNPKDFALEIDPEKAIDLVETADAFADLIVVTKGGSETFGIPLDTIVLDEVGPSNMSKLGADGKPIFHPETGKVLKGPNFVQPDIAKYL